ncbi:MAG TPA: glycoside hydrolase family 2 protein [Acidobacteriaceae bacterium]
MNASLLGISLACLALSPSLALAQTPARSLSSLRPVTDALVNSGWQFRSLNATAHPETANWMPATVPGVVPTDLLAAKLIPDPFYRDNELKLQWMGLTDWEYRTRLNLTPAQLAHRHLELVFDGLDTFADVYVNDHLMLQADNMFRTWHVEAKPMLHAGANELRIVFHSAITTMMPKVKALPHKLPTVLQVQAISEEGIATDPYVRKAPYSYGWDWGPRFVNEGIWKDVHLMSWDNARIENLHIAQSNVTTDVARLVAQVDVVATREETATLSVEGKSLSGAASGRATATVHLVPGENHLSLPMEIMHPALWYPLGYGAQARYEFRASLAGPGSNDHKSLRTGLRSVELRRDNDDIGQSFSFVINGKPVFAKGADVIPFDSFAPRVTPAQHRQILQSAADAHMNMVREWGGGYYESDDFYDIADELGIMVWQEFMFGGAQIPSDTDVPGFRENVRLEAVDQVDRLRDHPSIVLWCGNNEVETGWYHWGDRTALKKQLSKDEQEKVWQDYLVLMDDTLKTVVSQHAPEIPYTPSSPHANYEQIPDNPAYGDMHYWAVWGATTPVAEYNKITPRFMSEYGFQSFPEMRTIRAFAQPDDLSLNSAIMLEHQKNVGGNERIKKYMDGEYPKPKDFASFVYVSHVQQAEAIRVAADHLRSSRPRTMGSLYWQLNDCWPVASWASIDYYGRWKALQFYAKKFYADLSLAPWQHDGVIDTTVISDLEHPVNTRVGITLMGFDGKVYSHSEQVYNIPAAAAKQVSHLNVAELLGSHPASSTLAWFTLTVDGKQVAERALYFDHVKALKLPAATIEHTWSTANGKTLLTLRSENLARNVWVSFGDHDAQLSDNSFDLIPGHAVSLAIQSTTPRTELERSLEIMSLRDAFTNANQAQATEPTISKGQ